MEWNETSMVHSGQLGWSMKNTVLIGETLNLDLEDDGDSVL